MDSSEINKIVGSAIGALLVFLLIGFFSAKIYGTGSGGHHGEEILAYALEIEEPAGAEEEPEVIDIAALVASADADAGKKTFNQCKACHKIDDGANGIGPHLWNLVGRDIGGVDGFAYSAALADKGGVWDLDALLGFLENPGSWAPGTAMSYRGLRDVEDRVNLIVYLNEADGTPVELAAAPAATAEVAAAPAEVEAPATEEVPSAQTETPATEAEAPAVEETPAKEAEAPAAEEAPAKEAEAPAKEAAAPAAEAETTAEAPAEEVVVAAVGSGIDFSSGNADNGKKVFRQCRACHQVKEGRNGVGPSLYGVVGRDIASVDGFKYSDALANKDGVWSASNLTAFLEKPREWAKGTKMVYNGLKDEQDRIDLITYLNEADGSPDPLN